MECLSCLLSHSLWTSLLLADCSNHLPHVQQEGLLLIILLTINQLRVVRCSSCGTFLNLSSGPPPWTAALQRGIPGTAAIGSPPPRRLGDALHQVLHHFRHGRAELRFGLHTQTENGKRKTEIEKSLATAHHSRLQNGATPASRADLDTAGDDFCKACERSCVWPRPR